MSMNDVSGDWVYAVGQAVPDAALEWRNRDGVVIDMTDPTIEARRVELINAAGATVLTKTGPLEITLADTAPNFVCVWADTDLAGLPAGLYQFRASVTYDGGLPRYFRPGRWPTLRLVA